MQPFFETKIEFLKGIGPQKAQILNKDLAIFTFGDIVQHYPFRYEDRTIFHRISEVNDAHNFVQIKGRVNHVDLLGNADKKRFVAYFTDGKNEIELIWFRSIAYASKVVKPFGEYVVYGRPTWYHDSFSLAHPEIEPLSTALDKAGTFQPVYHTTEKLKNFGMDSRGFSKAMKPMLEQALPHIRETLPAYLVSEFGLRDKKSALYGIHFPKNEADLNHSLQRLKFEELFYNQLKIIQLKSGTKENIKGLIFRQIPFVNEFYKLHLPFPLTNAQKRVIREIYDDMKTGKQMNRLLQGDVGSGKTIVAFIAMLMAIDNQSQACLMAPTEILTEQHFVTISEWAAKLGLKTAKLTGSTKKSDRKIILEGLLSGEIQLLIGTHALLEDTVQFKNLGLCVIDEQHRFGVAQRSKLWQKRSFLNENEQTPTFPHILVMTATPIPRTLAMTFYGDLDVSVIDEMPAGRKPIKTVHRMESQRLAVFGFLKQEIALGRQVYIVYPLIEESEKMDLQDLVNGYESICREFPRPDYQVCMVHGRMKAAEKEVEMQRFTKNQAQIMMATTVVEVGVNVPNASVMLIQNAERFGLAQLHQLRGRVGRGAEQSYCILMTSNKLSHDTREKLSTMVRTNNGFEIAEADLKLRGPGDLMGTQQSGVLDLLIADLGKDQELLKQARAAAQSVFDSDRYLQKPENQMIKVQIESHRRDTVNWSRIS
ncbi:MAG: ATP-dependent DNA helicase RecG [Cytophagales bacterium]